MLALVRAVFVSLALVIAGACQSPGPDLSTTASDLVGVFPTTWDFGSVQVGQTSPGKTIIVSPTGYQYQTISAITENCAGFDLDLQLLPADVYRTCEPCCGDQLCAKGSDTESAAPVCCFGDEQSYGFTAYFKPTVAGTVSCVVTLTISSGNRQVTLTGVGQPPPIAIAVHPGSIDFGDVRPGSTSSPVPLEVSNTGGQTMTVSNVTVPAGYTLTTPTSYTVAAGATHTHTVTCKPTAVGMLGGKLRVTSNDPMRPTVDVPLACRGVDSDVKISPSPMTFPSTRIGEPVEANITIANEGAASMALESVELTGTDLTLVTAPPPGTVAPGASKTARVRLEAITSDPVSGTLVVTYASGKQATAQISGRALATSMAVTPDGDVALGPVCIGQSKTQEFTIRADQDGGFAVTDITQPEPPFTITAPTLPASVSGGGTGTAMFEVIAAPTDAGPAMASVVLTTDIPGGSPRMINLAIDGLPAGVSPSPSEGIDFGVSAVATTTVGQPVNLSNCTEAAITFGTARIEGEDAGDFAIVAAPESMMLEPTGIATWLVVMTGRTSGIKHAELAIDHDLGVARVPLTGEAAAPAIEPEDIAEHSYYTCSTGTRGGLAPLAAALGLLLVRRRRRRRA